MFAGGVTVHSGHDAQLVGKLTVVNEIVQPPDRLPVSPPKSSTAYKLHVPFGVSPPNVPRIEATPADGAFWKVAGAGAGKVSPVAELLGPSVWLAASEVGSSAAPS